MRRHVDGEAAANKLSGKKETKPQQKRQRHRVYYFAGGGFQSLPSGEHWRFLAQLCQDVAGPGSRNGKSVVGQDREIEIILVSYPLGPASPAPDSLPILRKWLARVLDDAVKVGDKVSLMGDSSGGNIALSLGFWAVENYPPGGKWELRKEKEIKEEGDAAAKKLEQRRTEPTDETETTVTDLTREDRIPPNSKFDPERRGGTIDGKKETLTGSNPHPKPDGVSPLTSIVCISPAVDLRNTNPEIPKANKLDPVLTTDLTTRVAQAWTANIVSFTKSRSTPHETEQVSTSDPAVSPLLNSDDAFRALRDRGVAIHGVVGTHDVLAPDALEFMRKCERTGVRGRWLVWEGQMHCFPLAGGGENIGIREGRVGRAFVDGVLMEDAKA
jgi:acetyl esterase/lipase